MRKYFFALLLACTSLSCSEEAESPIVKAPAEVDLSTSFYYTINLNDRSNDSFKVELMVDDLTAANGIFQFAATAPGTYRTANFGRFVKNFKAFDKTMKAVPTMQVSTNQWELTDPENTYIISYEVLETFDTPVDSLPIYKMAGTSIEEDHSLLNTFAVLGYPTGLKERDFYLKVDFPSGWTIGSSLPKTPGGLYVADDYDFLADNPIILGSITSTSTQIESTAIGVHAYSKSNQVSASQILNDIQQVLVDSKAFLKTLPVDRYNFLFLLQEANAGALEHSYSSVYVLKDQAYNAGLGGTIKNYTAHEFFHIVTPLNIHSEIIEDFNFANPTPSMHLWLYEGVTEWAAHMMQYRNGSIPLTTLFNRLRTKKSNANNANYTYSLTQLSTECYTKAGGTQFQNVYYKGALVATLLDIRLLELSNGTRGLREIILQLINTYGPQQAFSENGFFDYLVSITHPEINDFVNRYIKGTDLLPMTEYFAKVGIDYDGVTNTFAVNPVPSATQKSLFDKWSVNF
jgi:predicted metalloprotease with PDZ domain